MMLWILGKDGMLGSSISACCTAQNIPYIATSKDEANILRLDKVPQSFTHIINCVGYTDVEGAESNEEAAYALNVKGVENIARIARETRAKVVHFSTDYVFDGMADQPYKEEARCNPLSIYGKTKWEGEVRLRELCEDSLIIRTSWLFGRGEKHFVAKMLKLMKERRELSVVADQIGRPTYSYDLAKATLKLLPHFGTFHYCNAGVASWFSFAKEIRERAREPLACKAIHSVLSEEFRAAAKRPKYSVLSTKKAEKVLKTSPPDWKNALRQYFERYYD